MVAMAIGNHEKEILSEEANLRTRACDPSLEGPEFRPVDSALTTFSTMDPATL
jgi:hypothetical protein